MLARLCPSWLATSRADSPAVLSSRVAAVLRKVCDRVHRSPVVANSSVTSLVVLLGRADGPGER